MQLVRVTAKEQIKRGDILLIQNRDSVVESHRAVIVKTDVCDGNQTEEVIINKSRNLFFVTDLMLAGKSWAKDVRIVRNGEVAEVSGRGLVCFFCGEGFGYEGEEPDEATIRAAVDHEKICPKNPYLAELRTLREMEKQLCNRLGELARQCDIVIPWLQGAMGGIPDADIPAEVSSGIGEIMDYVEAVKPYMGESNGG